MRIDLYDGKYTYVCNDDGSDQHALRYGERWRDLTGDGFVLAMAQKIEELEQEVNHQQSYIDNALDNSKEQMIERIAELEESLRTVAQTRCVSYEDLAKRDLEQQVKAYARAEYMCPDSIRRKVNELREQAKGDDV